MESDGDPSSGALREANKILANKFARRENTLEKMPRVIG